MKSAKVCYSVCHGYSNGFARRTAFCTWQRRYGLRSYDMANYVPLSTITKFAKCGFYYLVQLIGMNFQFSYVIAEMQMFKKTAQD